MCRQRFLCEVAASPTAYSPLYGVFKKQLRCVTHTYVHVLYSSSTTTGTGVQRASFFFFFFFLRAVSYFKNGGNSNRSNQLILLLLLLLLLLFLNISLSFFCFRVHYYLVASFVFPSLHQIFRRAMQTAAELVTKRIKGGSRSCSLADVFGPRLVYILFFFSGLLPVFALTECQQTVTSVVT